MPTVVGVALALRTLKAAEPQVWAPLIVAACERHGIDTPVRVAGFMANVLHETGKLGTLVENLNYSVEALQAVFGAHRISAGQAAQYGRSKYQPANQRAIANIVYGGAWGLKNLGNTQPEDGFYFRGKGAIQLTGRGNHTRFAKAIGVDVVALQALLETKEGAIDSAASFWSKAGCNALVDRGDHTGARRVVNGGNKGLAEVLRYTAAILAVLRRA